MSKPASEKLLVWAMKCLEADETLAQVRGSLPVREFTDNEPSEPGIYVGVQGERFIERWSDACELVVFILFRGKRSDAAVLTQSVRVSLHRDAGAGQRNYALDPATYGLRVAKLRFLDGVPAGRNESTAKGCHESLMRFESYVA